MSDKKTYNSELYVYLGQLEDVYIFLHSIYNEEKYDDKISNQIFNCMINEKMIKNYNEKCIIFNIYNNKTINITSIDHKNCEKPYKYDNNILKKVILTMIQTFNNKSKDENYFIIEYMYEKKIYKIFEIPIIKLPKFLLEENEINISNINYYVTSKKIDYI